MLYQVLEEIEQADAPVTLQALSQRLAVEPSALQGMILFWVRKGRLRDDEAVDDSCETAGGCGDGCASGCAYTVKTPRAYTLKS